MSRERHLVDKYLEIKGFNRNTDSHHISFVYETADGKRTSVRTRISHGRDRVLSDTLMGMMARQCKLTRQQFNDLVDCPMDRSKYEAFLRDSGDIR
jgi:hypothetical protein